MTFREWVQANLPGVTYDRDAGGVWRYFRMLGPEDTVTAGDEWFANGRWGPVTGANWNFVGAAMGPADIGRVRRPIPRPTERLLDAMRASDGRMFHPLKPNQWTRHNDLATRWLTACEHSCQAEPGDGKPVPQEKGEEPPVPEWKRRIILAIQSGRASPEFLDWVGDVLLHVLESPGAVDDWVHDEADQLTKVTQ